MVLVFFFKQKTAYEMRISDWSSDVCSSDLITDVRLSRGQPLGRRFNTVIDRVTHDMGERIDNHLHHLAGHFDLAAFQRQIDLRAHFPANIPNQAREDRKSTRLNSRNKCAASMRASA